MKHINLSNLSHAALALVAQIIIGILTNNWWAGAVRLTINYAYHLIKSTYDHLSSHNEQPARHPVA